MRVSLKKFVKILVFAVMVMAAASTARASVVIDFSSAGAFGGTVTTDGTDWFATGIPILTVRVTGAPTNNGLYVVSGDASDIEFGTCCAALNFDTKLGTISIVGSVPLLGLGNQTLLSGTIASFGTSGSGSNFRIDADGPDQKSAELLRALGLPVDQQFAFFGFSQGLALNSDGTYYSTSSDITNVPEPGTLALFGVGLLGVARKLRKVVA